ncbi:MAG: hypothetical protein ACE14L_04830 [Terriglobales bacterium]
MSSQYFQTLGAQPQVQAAPPSAAGFPYTYGANVAIAVGGGQAQVRIQVLNHNFRCFLLMAAAAAGGPPAVFSTQVRVNGRDVQNQAIHSGCLWGTATDPFPLPRPLTFPKNSVIEFTFTDLSGAPNSFAFAMHGEEFD